MGNLNITLEGYSEQVVNYMVSAGYAKTKTEALRLALFEFDKNHKIVPDEETAYALVATKILSKIESGKEKTKPFSLKDL